MNTACETYPNTLEPDKYVEKYQRPKKTRKHEGNKDPPNARSIARNVHRRPHRSRPRHRHRRGSSRFQPQLTSDILPLIIDQPIHSFRISSHNHPSLALLLLDLPRLVHCAGIYSMSSRLLLDLLYIGSGSGEDAGEGCGQSYTSGERAQ